MKLTPQQALDIMERNIRWIEGQILKHLQGFSANPWLEKELYGRHTHACRELERFSANFDNGGGL